MTGNTWGGVGGDADGRFLGRGEWDEERRGGLGWEMRVPGGAVSFPRSAFQNRLGCSSSCAESALC